MPSVHWENKLHHSPSILSFLPICMIQTAVTYFCRNYSYYTGSMNTYILSTDILSSYQKPSSRPPAKKSDWILINHTFLNQAFTGPAISFLLSWQHHVPNKQILLGVEPAQVQPWQDLSTVTKKLTVWVVSCCEVIKPNREEKNNNRKGCKENKKLFREWKRTISFGFQS